VKVYLTTFGRLTHVSSLRDPFSGHYDSNGKSEGALRDAHKDLFTSWLALSLKQQKAELEMYISAEPVPPTLLWSGWLTQEGYRTLIPAAASTEDTELFASNLRISLPLLIPGRLAPAAGSNSNTTDKHDHSDWRVNRALDAAEQNYGNPTLGLALISKPMRVSARHLGTLFQRQTGRRFRHYLRGVRMFRAAE